MLFYTEAGVAAAPTGSAALAQHAAAHVCAHFDARQAGMRCLCSGTVLCFPNGKHPNLAFTTILSSATFTSVTGLIQGAGDTAGPLPLYSTPFPQQSQFLPESFKVLSHTITEHTGPMAQCP